MLNLSITDGIQIFLQKHELGYFWEKLNNFQPISLVGELYKIVAKVLANRLSLVVNKITSCLFSFKFESPVMLKVYSSTSLR
jgi:hypothetical protein